MTTHQTDSSLNDLTRSPSFSGVLLIISAAIAMIVQNSPWGDTFHHLLHAPLGFLSVHAWINDGLMAVFFFLVGLELKRELTEGALADRSQVLLPALAALGGMAIPSLVYLAITQERSELQSGWAIPSATDIAFAVGILGIVRGALPASLRIFLTTLAVLDDLGAILIIALFYSGSLSVQALAWGLIPLGMLALLNHRGVTSRVAYSLVGAALWVCVLKSGIHPTVAGVLTALFYPVRHHSQEVLHEWEHALQPYVVTIVLPLFALANAGVSFAGLELSQVINPLSIGIALGLFLGKQLGIFGATFVAVRLAWAKKPAHTSWAQIYGVSLLAGIGFTMSLFIASLAFSAPELTASTRVGVLGGSLLSAIVGWAVLSRSSQKDRS